MIQCERKLNGYRNNLKRKCRHIAQTCTKFSRKSVRNFLQTNNKVHTKSKKSGYRFSVSSGGYFSSFFVFFLLFFVLCSFRSFFDLRNDHTVYTHKSSCSINLMKLDGAIEVNKLHLFCMDPRTLYSVSAFHLMLLLPLDTFYY